MRHRQGIVEPIRRDVSLYVHRRISGIDMKAMFREGARGPQQYRSVVICPLDAMQTAPLVMRSSRRCPGWIAIEAAQPERSRRRLSSTS
jgi:hypothetical protein